jgi:L-alanine-DL-glutamate epimerase-like enolase superfamily enzyme
VPVYASGLPAAVGSVAQADLRERALKLRERGFTPHVSIGSAVHFAASLGCAAAMPNVDSMEHWIGDNPLAQIAADLDQPVGGRRRVAAGPGLGITVDEPTVRRLTAG